MNPDRWKQVSRIYGAVLTKPEAARAAVLAELCAGDVELRRDVESLLREEGAPILDRPAAETATTLLGEDLTGRTLGSYRLDAAIGVGGMGQVYRATDTRLHRTVAIKVLPASLAEDPQFRARFDREAKAIAALNHPHICTLHDVGHHEGVSYLVMELVDGVSLATRLERGAPPFEEALRYATEIADALAAAHRQGIVHRDLKPGNVMITKAGVKLLDFGLAKTAVGTPGKTGGPLGTLSMLPTTPPNAPPLTAQGTILGTFQYMAPEQLEGKEADARTDIFAFGALVYELFTGQKAFDGKSQASLIGAIMHAEPPAMSTRQPVTPPALDRLVRTCLAKDPDDRWQSARDVARELRQISQSPVAESTVARRRSSMLPFVVVVLVALVAGAAAAVFWSSRPASIVAAPNVVRFTVSPPNNGSWRSNPGGGSIPLAVSPDGRWVVLGVGQGGQEGQGLLWLRSLESPTLRPLAGTEGGRFPFWSPDSRTVAFFTQNALQRVGTTGDGAQRIREVENGRGGAWSADGTIIVSTFGSGLFRTTERGDVFDRLVFSETDLDVRLMAFLPDGRHFLALTGPTASDASAIYLAELGSKTVTRVIDDARGVAYSAGHVLFVRGQTLNALRFDERNLRVVGSPAPIAEGVGVSGNGTASFSASANGVLAHIGAIARPRQLTWRDRSGNRLGSVGAPAFVNTLFLSIDEHLLVTTRQDARSGVQSIWSTELTRNNLDAPIAEGNNAILSPAGDLLVSASPPPIGLQRLALAGSTKPEMLIDRKVVWPTDWSRDGRYLLVFHPEARTNFDVSVFDLVTRKLEPFVRTAADEAQPRFSPDGQWVAYASDLSGRPEIWVRPFGRDGSARRLSPEGGVQPRWRSDGKELYYVAPDRQIMAVALGAWDAETPPTAKALFQARIRGLQGLAFGQDYVPAELGQKFLVAEDVDGSGDNDLTVVLNWPAMVAK